MKYINDLKLKRAKELLNSGFYTVSDVATQAGFFDLSYFSRFFKKKRWCIPKRVFKPTLNHSLPLTFCGKNDTIYKIRSKKCRSKMRIL